MSFLVALAHYADDTGAAHMHVPRWHACPRQEDPKGDRGVPIHLSQRFLIGGRCGCRLGSCASCFLRGSARTPRVSKCKVGAALTRVEPTLHVDTRGCSSDPRRKHEAHEPSVLKEYHPRARRQPGHCRRRLAWLPRASLLQPTGPGRGPVAGGAGGASPAGAVGPSARGWPPCRCRRGGRGRPLRPALGVARRGDARAPKCSAGSDRRAICLCCGTWCVCFLREERAPRGTGGRSSCSRRRTGFGPRSAPRKRAIGSAPRGCDRRPLAPRLACALRN